jgi:hypothetical protein
MKAKEKESNPPDKAEGKFNYTPQSNGAYEDHSYGKNMGNPMQDLIGTEKISDPLGKGK